MFILYMLQSAPHHCTCYTVHHMTYCICYRAHHFTVRVHAKQFITSLYSYMLHSAPHHCTCYTVHHMTYCTCYTVHHMTYSICYTVHHMIVYATQFITLLYFLHCSSHYCTFYTIHDTSRSSAPAIRLLSYQKHIQQFSNNCKI